VTNKIHHLVVMPNLIAISCTPRTCARAWDHRCQIIWPRLWDHRCQIIWPRLCQIFDTCDLML